jgi:hypothetical protein
VTDGFVAEGAETDAGAGDSGFISPLIVADDARERVVDRQSLRRETKPVKKVGYALIE